MKGRPTKYNPENNENVIKLMSEGASITEVAALIGVVRETIWDWCNEESPRYNKVFSNTIKEGMALSEAWWEHQGRTSLRDSKFNSTLWYMNMKNRFKWADRQINDNNITATGLTISVNESVAKEIDKLNDRTDKDI